MHRIAAWVGAAWLCACAPSMPPAPADAGPEHPIIEYVEQQEVLTPLPLRVRLPASYEVEYVLALVRTWGSPTWEPVELGRDGQTWRGEVSCRQVSTVTGPTRYFFLALDEYGDAVLDSGSPQWPYVATIVGELTEGARGLPGEPVPARCHDVADCPPDFPGCPDYTVLRPACSYDGACDSGVCEWDGYCAVAEPDDDSFGVWADGDEQLARAIQKVKHRYRTALGPRLGPKLGPKPAIRRAN